MAQQTINVGAAPNDGTGTPLRTAFQYTNSNFTELYTAVGPSGNNIVVPGNATISGDLTVDTSTLKVDSTNNRVGIGTATPAVDLHIQAAGTASAEVRLASATRSYSVLSSGSGYGSANNLVIYDITGSAERWRLDNTGVQTWSNVGGVAGTAMTLNANGLGIGVTPTSTHNLSSAGPIGIAGTNSGTRTSYISNSGACAIYYTDGGGSGFFTDFGNLIIQPRTSAARSVVIATSASAGTPVERLIVDPNGNVGIGVTPSAWSGITALQISRGSFAADTGSYTLSQNVYNNGSNRYIASAAALQFQAIPGTGFLWFTAPSGTAGTAISFTERLRLKETGQLRFVPLASDPSGAEAGDVYYNSTSNKLKCYNGTTWNDLF